jgi:hypothetical protein
MTAYKTRRKRLMFVLVLYDNGGVTTLQCIFIYSVYIPLLYKRVGNFIRSQNVQYIRFVTMFSVV